MATAAHLPDSDDPFVQRIMTAIDPLRAPVVEGDSEVDRLQSTVDKVTDQFGKYLEGIHADDYTESALRDRIREFKDAPAGRALTTALEAATTYRDQARADVEGTLRSLAHDGDTAEELRNTRAWERARRILDSTPDSNVGTAAANLVRKANDSELGVLVQELRDYFDSRENVKTGDVEFKLAIKDRAPQYAAALDRATTAEKAYMVTRSNMQSLHDVIDNLRHPKAYQRPHLVDARAVANPKRRTVL